MVYIKDISSNEIKALLVLLKSPEHHYNARSLSSKVGITPMGMLKILKKTQHQDLLKSQKIGNATIYSINWIHPYVAHYLIFLLLYEKDHTSPLVKRWIREISKVKHSQLVILYGSTLTSSNPHDIDVLFLTDKAKFRSLKQEIREINTINVKKIHPLYQTYDDFIENIKKKNGIALAAMKGIIVNGAELFVNICYESSKE